MRRLYYLANDLHTCISVQSALRESGVRDGSFHVVSRDEIGLYQHQISAAAAYQRLDVVHAGERWALAGGGFGLLLGMAGFGLAPAGWSVNASTVALLGLVGGLFGAWRGALLGMSRDSYKIARFARELAAGRHLLMIDVDDRNRAQVRAMLSVRFPSVRFCGRDTTLIGPFGHAAPG